MKDLRREAPVIVNKDGLYYMLSSACTGWAPNQCKLSTSKKLDKGWSQLENIGDDKAFRTQAAAVLEIKGTKQTTYLYVGDRWLERELPASRIIISLYHLRMVNANLNIATSLISISQRVK